MNVSPSIEELVHRTLADLPTHVTLVAAAKMRSVDEVRAAVASGVRIVGQNYVQEAQRAIAVIGRTAAAWHMIGHLQRNKVKQAVRLFDMIQTVDSFRLAEKIDQECRKIDRTMPVLIEINSAREPQKSGILPEEAVEFVRELLSLRSVRIEGLMTVGPLVDDPEEIRPYFAESKRLFDELRRLAIPNVRMEILSMGMSDSYPIAIEEGANMVRLGTILFGPRD